MKTKESLKTTDGIELSYSKYISMALLYLALPVVIFILGYLKIYWALLFSGMIVAGVVYAIKDSEKDSEGISTTRKINIPYSNLVIVCLVTLFLLIFAGVGEFGYCLEDHTVRYAILNDLVNYKWPVIYDFSTQSNPIVAATLGDGSAAFSYYFAFWMIPALVGKVFGLMAARIALLVWCMAGIALVTTGIYFLNRKSSLFLFAALMMFAGLDVIPFVLYTPFRPEITFEGWNYHMFIHGNLYQLFNVYNQAIPGWLIAVLILNSRSNRSLGLMGALMFCYSPWATIGMVPVCIERLITPANWTKDRKTNVRNILSIGNLLVPVAAVVCFGLLYTSNANATEDKGLIWLFYDSPLQLIKDYIGYVIFEFGIWAFIIYKSHKKNPLFWTCVGTLMIMPIYKITAANDFLMRGSLIPMFILSVYAILEVNEANSKSRDSRKAYIRSRVFSGTLFASAFVAFVCLVLSITASVSIWNGEMESLYKDIDSFGNIAKEEQLPLVEQQFYVYNYDETPFFKYLAK